MRRVFSNETKIKLRQDGAAVSHSAARHDTAETRGRRRRAQLMRRLLIRLLSLSTVAVTAALSPQTSPRALCRMSTPAPANSPSVLWRLAGVGAVVGPAVDAVHNQALLAYDVLPVAVELGLGVAKTRSVHSARTLLVLCLLRTLPVSGVVVYSARHSGCSAPLTLVMADHWLIYHAS